MGAVEETSGGAIRYLYEDGVATIVLATPDNANRFTLAAMQGWIAALEASHADRAVVLLVRAEGEDFTLGRDQRERPQGVTRKESLSLILRANELLATFPGASIALVQGRAFGFGSGIALHCDITLAADDATLGFDEVLHQLAPLVVVDYLVDFVGRKVAAELVMTGRSVPAPEAHALGMVNRLVLSEDLEQAGAELVAHLRTLSAGALRLMKQYALDDASGALADPGAEGVARLDAWIAAGRPDEV
ncbi:MAG TPA: enoyl-CoA hydratase/isomerase family protein [Conexibacter sp.]|jgi:enoyl-CoA hydratase/carnithine racemase